MTDEANNPQAASVDELQAQNDQLRASLAAENATLAAKLAESQAASEQATGLTDEDIRRAEHPEEFGEGDPGDSA
jgi:hypothetical protein